jgi:hypothetical protein
MNCGTVLDKVYDHEKMSLITRIRIGMHLMVCPNCAQKIERFEVCRDILQNEFFPSSPGLEETVIAMITAEEAKVPETQEAEVAGGFSTRGWVIAGLVMFVSLATAFFGLGFSKVAHASGMSFMLPIGITIGIVLTSYGALFIGSHLKEFTHRFGL